jgi:hypothetical protein
MRSVLETCVPRQELLTGTFNPDVFTPSLEPIIRYYKRSPSTTDIDLVYTDPEIFFTEATYSTMGLRQVLEEVFGRIAGDMMYPAIHRLETSFGGGKTHALIACTHIAHCGTDLVDMTNHLISRRLLPTPGSVAVVGVSGDTLDVHTKKGTSLEQHTLWGEIARQVGGDELYRKVEDDATSPAAPGRSYFDTVLGGRKVLIMLDELAQYAARLEAAKADGASQLAAFIMALNAYVKSNPGIAVIVTLASSSDAFSRQSERLAQLLTEVRGSDVGEAEAVGIGERAVKDVLSVTSRDAVGITPVQPGEISAVLAKRLFDTIDRDAAAKTADAYMNMYRTSFQMLPEEATRPEYHDRMVSAYPFHPTFLDLLNTKLSESENFQGTRGVLRVFASAVQSIWEQRIEASMIHAAHLDLRSSRIVDELLGRTGSRSLISALNTDVGGVSTASLDDPQSNAERADRGNPHPEGFPWHEYTWKTVFLHSLVGRESGLQSKLFGINEIDAALAVAQPGLTPFQVRKALENIVNKAYFLRYQDGRYFASDEPTINSVLAQIRKGVTQRQIEALLHETARKVVSNSSWPFEIIHDVSAPEHIPDRSGRPCLGVVALGAESINVKKIITTAASGTPRKRQNLVFLLIPKTVKVNDDTGDGQLFGESPGGNHEIMSHIYDTARSVQAYRILRESPQSYGIDEKLVRTDEVERSSSEREQALLTALSGAYSSLYYPSAREGFAVKAEIKSVSGESGMAIIEQVNAILEGNRKLLVKRGCDNLSTLRSMKELFFETSDIADLASLRRGFEEKRRWPILEEPSLFETLVRSGVEREQWVLARLDPSSPEKATDVYENSVPMAADLTEDRWVLVTPDGARKRMWTGEIMPNLDYIRHQLIQVIESGAATFNEVHEALSARLPELKSDEVRSALKQAMKEGVVCVQSHAAGAEDGGVIGPTEEWWYEPLPDDVIVLPSTPPESQGTQSERYEIRGESARKAVMPLIPRLASFYKKGAKCTVKELVLYELELPKGGTLTMELKNVPPDSMAYLDELLQSVDLVAKLGLDSEVELALGDVVDDCTLLLELIEDA